MPPSEIDAIFASKGKGKGKAFVSSPPNPPLSPLLPDKKKKKKKQKEKEQDNGKEKEKSTKRKHDDDNDDAEAAPSKPTKRHVPETVFDTSTALPLAKKSRFAKPEKMVSSVAKVKKPKKDREEEERFKDSRGTGPRRRTDEGFVIYKEDELGISAGGGDTPLCPFDCQCCF
ncbi:hypothetical protein C8Q74DRAFT_184607 [Fomes fomentarius]|nr:hypothetical protein C8Q74DRAFT_184607 [Fomes fomentarius]